MGVEACTTTGPLTGPWGLFEGRTDALERYPDVLSVPPGGIIDVFDVFSPIDRRTPYWHVTSCGA